jgi:RNA polymerase sigma-70 factor, ECF subfamily
LAAQHNIEDLYNNYKDALYGIALKVTQNADDAADVLQTSFVKIWKNLDGWDASKGTIFTYMLNITRNTAIDFTRSKYAKNKRLNQSSEILVNTGGEETADGALHKKMLQEAVAGLQGKYYDVIDMVYLKGYTQEQTAEILQIPLGTIKSRIRAAILKLRDNVSNE